MINTYHKNPRQITQKQFKQLSLSLEQLGDLSGNVHNIPSNEWIGGNQRSRVFGDDYDLELTHEFDEPDVQGTVALGFILWNGKRYAYRAVTWDEATCERTNITANKAGGSWDFDILGNQFEQADLLDWGFEDFEVGIGGDVDLDQFFETNTTEPPSNDYSSTITLEYSQEDYDMVVAAFGELDGTKEQNVWKFLGL